MKILSYYYGIRIYNQKNEWVKLAGSNLLGIAVKNGKYFTWTKQVRQPTAVFFYFRRGKS